MNRFLTTFLILLLTLPATGCELVGDILELGFWMGVIVVALFVLVIWWIVRMIRGRPGGPTQP